MSDSPEARFRHDLLTPVNHILGFCSLLIDSAEVHGDLDRVADLQTLLADGRRVLETIEEALPSVPVPGHRPDYPLLAERLAIPAEEILRGCERLESILVGYPHDDQAESLDDLARIREASQRLIEMTLQGPSGASAA